MTNPIKQVGAPDPKLRNSPVIEELAEDFEVLEQEVPETPLCYFNDIGYRHGEYVCSGHELLRCVRGSWVQSGSCDPDNP